ncbi:MAG: RidA family protein [Minwuia sp.]|uniref:RidA family protein n=1 Tax=Minwuia sp. TaxID=2493630 RepID=UPI003A8B5289
MNKVIRPGTIPEPLSKFAHAIEVPPGARQVFVSGQVGVDAHGKLGDDIETQIRNAFDNVQAVLQAADMTLSDVVRLNTYLTDANDVGVFRAIRDEIMDGVLTASTLVMISALVHPAMKVEIECVAAKA